MNSKHINKKYIYMISIFLIIVLTIIDRLLKIYAYTFLKDHPSKSIIKGILEFRYLENNGAAFGLLNNQTSFFILVGFVVIITCIYIIIKTPARQKYISANILLAVMLAGTIGNLIDRIRFGSVIDFIYFRFLNFPIFNFADILVSLSTIISIVLLLFYYTEDDLNFMKFMEKKIRDVE